MQPGAFATHLAPALAGTVSFVLMLLLLRSRNLPLDQPNERSLHAVPVPRIGGVAIMLAILAAALLLQADPAILVPAALLALTSYFDDRRALPAATRLAVHLLAAAAFLFWTGMAMGAMWLVLLLAIGWLTNLYNFMDGADGLAGGMAVIGFFAYGIAAWVQGGTDLALLGFSIAAAAAGFLVFNFPPARIFMGDVGSIPLGFLVGALGVAGWQRELWPLWFPLVVFSPFVADASLTLLRRLLRGERVWQAHRQHYYQRLILSGWSHRRTALSEFVLMSLCAAVALACLDQTVATQVLALAVLALVLVLAMWSVDRRWARHTADANA